MAYIDVRFNFDTETEDDGYVHYSLTTVERTGTDIPDDAMQTIGETLAQSDHWTVGGTNATVAAMTEPEVQVVKDYW